MRYTESEDFVEIRCKNTVQNIGASNTDALGYRLDVLISAFCIRIVLDYGEYPLW